MNPAFLDKINSQRLGTEELNPVTAFQIGLQMTHRLVALAIVLLVGCVAWKARREQGVSSLPAKLAATWWWVICLQAALGIAIIWSNKAADVATAHVLCGASSLLAGTILSVDLIIQRRLRRQLVQTPGPAHREVDATAQPPRGPLDALGTGAIPELLVATLKEAQ